MTIYSSECLILRKNKEIKEMEDLKGEETCHLQGKISAKMKVNTRI